MIDSLSEFWEEHNRYRQSVMPAATIGVSDFWRLACGREYRKVTLNIPRYEDMGGSLPSSPSLYRTTGLAMWDTIMTRYNAIEHRSADNTLTGPVKPKEFQNKLWTKDSYTNERGRYTYATPIYLPGYIDFHNEEDGFELYEAAHVLTHLWADPVSLHHPVADRQRIYNGYFKLAVANIVLSHAYGIPIYVKAAPNVERWKVPSIIGLDISVFSGLGEPTFSLRKQDVLIKSNFDTVKAMAFIAVYPQAHITREAITTNHNDILYNMGPMRALVVGWELMDFILLKAQVARGSIRVQPEDMYCSENLWDYIQASTVIDSTDYMPIYEWIRSADYNYAWRRTPPSPCRACLKQVPGSVGYISNPTTKTEIAESRKQLTEIFKITKKVILLNTIERTGRTRKAVTAEFSQRKALWKAKMADLQNSYNISKYLALELY